MIEKELLLPENIDKTSFLVERKLTSWNIDTVCCDKDGTLVDTRSLFNSAMLDACGFLLFGEDWYSYRWISEGDELKKGRRLKEEIMDEVVRALRPEFQVNPAIMEMGVLSSARILCLADNDKRVNLALDRVRDIYRKDIPAAFEGAEKTIDVFNKAGRRTFLMSHAEESFVWPHLVKNRLIGKFERIGCFSVDKPKSTQWQYYMDKFKIDPKKSLIIGDNLYEDILPVLKLGAPKGIWISEGQASDERIITVSEIGEVIPAIIQTL